MSRTYRHRHLPVHARRQEGTRNRLEPLDPHEQDFCPRRTGDRGIIHRGLRLRGILVPGKMVRTALWSRWVTGMPA